MPISRNRKKELLRARRGEILARLLPEMQRLSQELHNGEYAPAQSEYVLFSEKGVNHYDLYVVFGKWKEVAAACGMELATGKYYYAKRKERQENMESLVTYQIRDDELLASQYRPPVKIRLADKKRAAQLCANIADEKERLRVWLFALGYPEQVMQQWL